MIVAILFVLGLCLGSFVSALTWRLRQQGIKTAKPSELSILSGRSMCAACRHQLAWYDLVPLFSWLSLKGKCRYCGNRIQDSPLTELITALLFSLSYLFWPAGLAGWEWLALIVWLILVVIGMALAVYDLRHMQLPDKLVYSAGVIVALFVIFTAIRTDARYLLDAALGLVAFGGLFYVIFQFSDGRWIGGGDVKLGFVLGGWLADFRLSLLAIFAASLAGSLLAAFLALNNRASWHKKLPFGPLLLGGTLIATLFGDQLINWYLNLVTGSY